MDPSDVDGDGDGEIVSTSSPRLSRRDAASLPSSERSRLSKLSLADEEVEEEEEEEDGMRFAEVELPTSTIGPS
jgi:hypothetical protein